jgi:hypothetical protein
VGDFRPCSYADSVGREVPARRASSSWVSPELTRTRSSSSAPSIVWSVSDRITYLIGYLRKRRPSLRRARPPSRWSCATKGPVTSSWSSYLRSAGSVTSSRLLSVHWLVMPVATIWLRPGGLRPTGISALAPSTEDHEFIHSLTLAGRWPVHPSMLMICSATAVRSGPMMPGGSPSGLSTMPGRATNAAWHPVARAPAMSQE